jgi:xanthine dehydrogenase YagS FAD-binding subunit
MKNFAYAQPRSEAEVLQVLGAQPGHVELLAGGTDLVGLMKQMVVTPDCVVNIADIESLRQIEPSTTGGLVVGACVRLDEFRESSLADRYPAVKQAIQGINSLQLQAQGTLAGELFRRPRCWYFRGGHGLLAGQGRLVVEGDNRFHAILGNQGPAKFVHASRLAPALISLGAQARVIGPNADDVAVLPLEALYHVPRQDRERETTLARGQLVTHILLPPDDGRLSAAYEVRHGEGPDPPLTAAAATLEVTAGTVQGARIVMGQVAPIPWISDEAARAIIGQPITEETSAMAGMEAVAGAMPLSQNEYKVQLAQVAVQRAILRAAGLDTGGF